MTPSSPPHSPPRPSLGVRVWRSVLLGIRVNLQAMRTLDGSLLTIALLGLMGAPLFGLLTDSTGPAPVPARLSLSISLWISMVSGICLCTVALRQLRRLPGWWVRLVPGAAIVCFFGWILGIYLQLLTGNSFNRSWSSALYALEVTSIVLIGVSMPIVLIALFRQLLRQSEAISR